MLSWELPVHEGLQQQQRNINDWSTFCHYLKWKNIMKYNVYKRNHSAKHQREHLMWFKTNTLLITDISMTWGSKHSSKYQGWTCDHAFALSRWTQDFLFKDCWLKLPFNCHLVFLLSWSYYCVRSGGVSNMLNFKNRKKNGTQLASLQCEITTTLPQNETFK